MILDVLFLKELMFLCSVSFPVLLNNGLNETHIGVFLWYRPLFEVC